MYLSSPGVHRRDGPPHLWDGAHIEGGCLFSIPLVNPQLFLFCASGMKSFSSDVRKYSSAVSPP